MARFPHNHAASSNGDVHRFRDLVATHLPGMPDTIYLSAREARAYAKALNAAARDIGQSKFVDSNFGTQTIAFERTDRFRK